MLVWQDGKGPGETADFDIDWTIRLGADTIVSSTWSITAGDAPASGTLVINSSDFTTLLTKVWLAAGNVGITYTLLNTVTTAAGDTLTESVQLPVRNQSPIVNLTTLANAMQWLGVTNDDDGTVERLISVISTQIQRELGFSVLQASYARTFDGQGSRAFFVPDLPLVSVASLTIDGVSIPKGTPGTRNVGFYNNASAISLIGYHFCRGFQNIAASYTAGYQSVPADLEQACLDWAKSIYMLGKMPIPPNVVRVSAGDTTLEFGGSGAVTDPKKIPIPEKIYAVIRNYRRVSQISGW